MADNNNKKKEQPFAVSLIYGSCFFSCMFGFEVENRLSLFPPGVLFTRCFSHIGCSELRREDKRDINDKQYQQQNIYRSRRTARDF